MLKARWIAAAVLGAALGTATPPTSFAKPTDLPVDGRISCPEGRDGPGAEIDLGPLCPCLVPAGRAEQPAELVRVAPVARDGAAEKARRLFEQGDRCRGRGDTEGARKFFEEAHLLSPTSHYGQLAIQRLMDMESSGAAAEEQEPPAAPAKPDDSSEQRFRRVRETTQPLGTVEPASY